MDRMLCGEHKVLCRASGLFLRCADSPGFSPNRSDKKFILLLASSRRAPACCPAIKECRLSRKGVGRRDLGGFSALAVRSVHRKQEDSCGDLHEFLRGSG
jgi:hypothetical protein